MIRALLQRWQLWGIAAALSLALMVFGSTTTLQAAEFEILVDGIADDADLLVLGANSTCDLREAIIAANQRASFNQCMIAGVPDPDPTVDNFAIRFDVGVLLPDPVTIPIVDELPAMISHSILIDGAERVTLLASPPVSDPPLAHGLWLARQSETPRVAADTGVIAGLTFENFEIAVRVDQVQDAEIGQPALGGRNYFFGNRDAIIVQGSDATGALIRNNYIGIDDSGAINANTGNGITVRGGAEASIIGGIGIQRNVISGNDGSGIIISNSRNNQIDGNIIGRTPAFVDARGNGGVGLRILQSQGDRVENNLIGSNGSHGVTLNQVTDINLSKNNIGTPLTGDPAAAGNGGYGILVLASTNGDLTDNSIAYNGLDGVQIDANSRQMELDSALIFANGGLGIDLLPADGVTPNDSADPDAGANDLQNYPVITNAATDGTTLVLEGELVSAPGLYDIIFYVSRDLTGTVGANGTACDASGFGEGQSLLLDGATPLRLNNVAPGTFAITATGSYTAGRVITALAINRTDAMVNGNTSEFSSCAVIADNMLVVDFVPRTVSGLAPLTVDFVNLSTGLITDYEWLVDGVQVATTRDATLTFPTVGTYTVLLRVTDQSGTTLTATGTVTVTDVATSTPTPTSTPVNTDLPPATATNTDVPPPTATNTDVPPPTATNTDTPIPSPTPSATQTSTATNTATQTATVTATATSTATSTATQTATVTATATSTATRTATQTQTATSTLTPTITPTTFIEVTKVAEDDDTVNIDVINGGDSVASDVIVREELRAPLEYVAARPGAPICIESGGIITCQLGDLDAGGFANVQIDVNTNGANPDSGVTSVEFAGAEPVRVVEPYIIKLGQPPVALPGDTVTYTIRVINPTRSPVIDVRVTDQMPDAVEILRQDASDGQLRIDGQAVLFELDVLPAGGRVTITIETRVRADQSFNQIVNEACISSSGNATERCAQFSFLRTAGLPNTGQTPLWISLLRVVAGAVSAGALLWLALRFVRRQRWN